VVVLHVSVSAKPEHAEELLAAAIENATASNQEPGCLRFDVIRDRDDAARFYFYEVYRDDEALAAHRQTAHFKAYYDKVQTWLAAPPERRLGINVLPADANWR